MDKFIDKNVFPAATDAVKGLSGSLADLAKFINKTIGGGPNQEPGWWDKITSFFSGGNAMPTEAVELDFAAADGDYVTKGQVGIVGEQGPELFAPSQNGNIMNKKQATALYEFLLKQGGMPMYKGFGQMFLPGVGQLNRQMIAGGQVDQLTGFGGEEILKAAKYGSMGNVFQQITAGGQKYMQGYQSRGIGDERYLTAGSGWAQMSGPGGYYDKMMSGVSPFKGQSLKMADQANNTYTSLNAPAAMMEFQKEMYGVLSEIASNTRTGADTSKQILRATSS
jgi:hypothetical protein